jgi:tetratricopeptide (TPR) repeat protein
MLGRAFLHLVPNAGGDRDVRLWYQAVGSHLWSEGNYAELRPLVRRGLEIFPADAEILFLLGAMHEAQGAPHIQAAADSLRALSQRSPGRLYQLQIGSPQRERGDAEEAYREALRTTPSHAEARLRLGRVLSLNGRHTEAAARLREAIEGTTEAKLRYLGHLFLARVEEWRGRTAAAATQYDAAARLFPRALSPRLALSQIALQAGNRGDARQILALLAEEPGGDDDDPWWAYHRDRVPASDTWLARLRASVAESVQ